MEPAGQEVDFLDVKFSLNTGKYEPYAKPNNELSYVHTKSNHPPKVIKNIPKGIATRLTSISADEETFNIHKESYVEALKKAGHKEDLVYRKEVAQRIINEAANKEPGVCKKKRKNGCNII